MGESEAEGRVSARLWEGWGEAERRVTARLREG
jgi:hypothetical protein